MPFTYPLSIRLFHPSLINSLLPLFYFLDRLAIEFNPWHLGYNPSFALFVCSALALDFHLLLFPLHLLSIQFCIPTLPLIYLTSQRILF